jgi:hypothetical protein
MSTIITTKIFRTVAAIFASLLISQVIAQDAKPLTPKQVFNLRNDSVVTVVTDKGSGSGFFVKNGLVVATCFHVIKGAKSISIEGTQGIKWSVGAIWLDQESDAALLKLTEDSGRKPIPIGDFSKLSTGDDVCVIGNPLGFLSQTLTTGIVSAKRNDGVTNLIQTTAAISPGSSGSPLLNMLGEFVGFASFHFTEGQALNMAVSSSAIVGLFADSPIPIGSFFETNTRVSVKTEPTPSSKPTKPTSETAALRATQAFAKYYSGIAKKRIGWATFWNKDCASPSSDGTQFVKNVYDWANNCNEAVSAYKPFLDEAVRVWEYDKFDAFFDLLTSTRSSLPELAAAQCAAKRAAQYDHARLNLSNQESNAKYANLGRLLRQMYDQMDKQTWFDWEMFRQSCSPWAIYYSFGEGLEGIDPDPAIDNECIVGYSRNMSELPIGSRIIGVKRPTDSTYTSVSTWISLQDQLISYTSGSNKITEVDIQFDGPKRGTIRWRIR